MKTLEEHVARWRDCRRCGHHATRTQVVTGSWFLQKPAEDDPLIVVIGEAPGAEEDRTGESFVGVSGQLLRNEILVPAGVKFAFLANCVACFPSDVIVESPSRIEGAYRRLYQGELVKLVCESGGFVPATPNHPILTQRGVVSANTVVEGDYLVRSVLRDGVAFGYPHIEDVPSRIDEVFHALDNAEICQRAAGTAMDFHGDGREGEIDIVGSDRFLRYWSDPSFGEFFCEQALAATSDCESPFKGLCTGDARFFVSQFVPQRSRFGATGSRIACEMLSVGERHRSVAIVECFASCPGNAGFSKPLFHEAEGGAHLLGDLLGGETGLVKFDSRCKIKSDSPGCSCECQRLCLCSEFNAVREEKSFDGVVSSTSACGDQGHRFTGQIALDRVRCIENLEFRGHVFNLSTSIGWYTANGFIVSNCRPDGNRDPSSQELEACMPRLLELLDVLQPDGVLAVGRFAAERMSVMRIRIPTVSIRHPAWMLRKGFAERQRAVASAVKAVQRLLRELGVVAKDDRPEHVHRLVHGGVWRAVDGAEEPFKLCADCGAVVEEVV